jgi:hypothetical protein
MTTKTRVLSALFLLIIVAAFVSGYWPEHRNRTAAEAEAQALGTRVARLEDQVRAARLHGDLLTLIDAVEAMNYGQAQTLASTFFDRIRDEAARTGNPELRAAFQNILGQRDAVTGALAKGEATATTPLKESERTLRQTIAG